jgi:hypothetical protein
MTSSPCSSMKKSDSSSELNEDECSSCFINFLHLRSHTVDAVVDGNTAMKEEDAAGMMDDDDNDMIDDADDAHMSEDNDANKTKKPPPPPPVSQEKKKLTTRQPRYPSPSPEDITSGKPSSTTPPPLPRKRGDFINEPLVESLSTSSSAAELQQHSSTSLSIPALTSGRFPPDSILPLSSHLIITNLDDDAAAPLLALNSPSNNNNNNNANPNEADDDNDTMTMPQIPRINLQMRQSSNPHRRVIETNNSNRRLRPPAGATATATTQQTMETRQAEGGGFVPIQQQDSREEDDDEDDEDDEDANQF